MYVSGPEFSSHRTLDSGFRRRKSIEVLGEGVTKPLIPYPGRWEYSNVDVLVFLKSTEPDRYEAGRSDLGTITGVVPTCRDK